MICLRLAGPSVGVEAAEEEEVVVVVSGPSLPERSNWIAWPLIVRGDEHRMTLAQQDLRGSSKLR